MAESTLRNTEYYLEVARGNITGASLVHKFGTTDITTSMAPIANAGLYQTPTSAVALEFVSDSAADAQNGVGAREITFIGLNSAWEEVSQSVATHATDGTVAVSIPTSLTRLYRWYVSQSGTYATQAGGSHQGAITVRVAGAGATWSIIPNSPFQAGQSQIGVYTVPLGKTAYLLSKTVFVDSSKTADVYFFQRPLVNDVTTPFTGTMRLVEREVGVTGGYVQPFISPKGPFVGPCDIGFMGKMSVGTSDASVEFELLLTDN